MVEDVARELSRALVDSVGACGPCRWLKLKCFKQIYHTMVCVCFYLRSLKEPEWILIEKLRGYCTCAGVT